MDGCVRSWFHFEKSLSFRFCVDTPITVGSIHLHFTPKMGSVIAANDMDCILWAKCTPAITAADAVLSDHPPCVIALFRLNVEGVSVASSLKWKIGENSVVSVLITRRCELLKESQGVNGSSVLDIIDENGGEGNSKEVSSKLCHEMDARYNVAVTFVGVGTESNSQRLVWRPLLLFRWFELKEHIREATPFLRRHEKRAKRQDKTKIHKRRMITGDVRQAFAVSLCGNYILWQDGTLGLRQELVPYKRVFTPATVEKTVRVRRFPHRFADVVGVIPYGQLVEAIGRKVDRYTGEEYALLILSGTQDAVTTAETYRLQYIEPNKWVWGWSKIRSSSGLPLLIEVKSAISSRIGDEDWVEHLKEPTYYTSVREDRSVRIRSRPSLGAEVMAHLEPNEVKMAVAVHHLPAFPRVNSVPLLQQFVEWEDGGFSLLRSNERVYLAPVRLQSQPRHFPVCPFPAPKSPEVIPLYRKRRRTVSPSREQSGSETFAVSPQDLWSPADVPETVTADLNNGFIRLEDLPIIDLCEGASQHSVSSDTRP